MVHWEEDKLITFFPWFAPASSAYPEGLILTVRPNGDTYRDAFSK